MVDSLEATTPASLRAVQDQLSTLARSENSPGVFVADLRGRIVAVFPAQPELIGVDHAVRTAGPYVSEAYRTAVTGHPLVVGVSAPVSRGLIASGTSPSCGSSTLSES